MKRIGTCKQLKKACKQEDVKGTNLGHNGRGQLQGCLASKEYKQSKKSIPLDTDNNYRLTKQNETKKNT